jgi:hypothetical protein
MGSILQSTVTSAALSSPNTLEKSILITCSYTMKSTTYKSLENSPVSLCLQVFELGFKSLLPTLFLGSQTLFQKTTTTHIYNYKYHTISVTSILLF